MAVPEELVRQLQAQVVKIQETTAAQLVQIQANMQTAFDAKLAELTRTFGTAAAVAGTAAATAAGEGRGERLEENSAKYVFDERNFKLSEKFDGGGGVQWEEWKFQLLMTIRGKSPECAKGMDEALYQAGLTRELDAIVIDSAVKDKFGASLFKTLVQLTTGEANVVVRSVNDRGGGWCGFAALCLLSQRFNPKTPARVLQYLTAVLSPPPVKDVRLLERAIEEWESKRCRLKSEFAEEFSDNVSIAILTSMIPRDLQDYVFQQGQLGKKLLYREVRDKIMSIASHRTQMVTPAPMDVGCLGEAEEWEGEEQQDIDAVTRGNCYACGGWGHLARDCATRAAKGGKGGHKGGKSGGKAPGKGMPPNTLGKGVPGKGGGKGYGYQGTCYNCGVVGHKAAECTWRPQQVQEVVQEAPAQQATKEVSSVWSINAVTHVVGGSEVHPGKRTAWTHGKLRGESSAAVDGWHIVRGKWRRTETFGGTSGHVTCNDNPVKVSRGRFGVLSVHEVTDEALKGDEVWICPVGREETYKDEVSKAVCGVLTEITVDSAAEESVCPMGWAEQFGMTPVEPDKAMKLVNASGGRIAHWGSRRVRVQAAGVERPLDIGFQVTDVKKPLLSVRRLCEQGNVVQFGEDSRSSFVMNVETGERIPLQRRGNSWVIPSKFAHPGDF